MSDLATTLKKICAAFNAHDLDEIMRFFADDCVLELPRGTQPWVAATRVSDTASTGISKWLLTGTTPTGVKVKVQGCDFYTFGEDGKVTRKDSYWKIVE